MAHKMEVGLPLLLAGGLLALGLASQRRPQPVSRTERIGPREQPVPAVIQPGASIGAIQLSQVGKTPGQDVLVGVAWTANTVTSDGQAAAWDYRMRAVLSMGSGPQEQTAQGFQFHSRFLNGPHSTTVAIPTGSLGAGTYDLAVNITAPVSDDQGRPTIQERIVAQAVRAGAVVIKVASGPTTVGVTIGPIQVAQGADMANTVGGRGGASTVGGRGGASTVGSRGAKRFVTRNDQLSFSPGAVGMGGSLFAASRWRARFGQRADLVPYTAYGGNFPLTYKPLQILVREQVPGPQALYPYGQVHNLSYVP